MTVCPLAADAEQDIALAGSFMQGYLHRLLDRSCKPAFPNGSTLDP